MPKIINNKVRVHTCKLDSERIPFDKIEAGGRYVLENIDLPYQTNFYQKIKRCRCKRWVPLFDANERVKQGEALRVLRHKKGKVVEDEYQIWMPMVRVASKLPRVPRIDLITSRDIEGAYVEENKRFIRYIEEVHKMYMEERAKLIKPFRPDPFEGRVLFLFKDERTGRGLDRGSDD